MENSLLKLLTLLWLSLFNILSAAYNYAETAQYFPQCIVHNHALPVSNVVSHREKLVCIFKVAGK